jgi:ABC-type lipoprotein export system ATPase subunit
MSNKSPLLELQDIYKQYESAGRTAWNPVLQGIDLKVTEGSSLAVVGPSGSGKSTLLNLMGCLDHPSSGKVLLAGRDLSTCSDRDLSRIRNQDIGFIFQLHHLLPQCTALENVLIPTIPYSNGKNEKEMSDQAENLLVKVGLKNQMHQFPGQLSGGECQRIAVVRALINSPKLLLADEPTGSLDSDTAAELGKLLTDLNREIKITLIVVTHSLELAKLMGRTYRLDHGKLKAIK